MISLHRVHFEGTAVSTRGFPLPVVESTKQKPNEKIRANIPAVLFHLSEVFTPWHANLAFLFATLQRRLLMLLISS